MVAPLNLALGTVQFGLPYGIANKSGKVDLDEARAMLQIARTRGIDTLDTAISYGESEAVLGQVGVKDFRIVTKLPARPDACENVCDWMGQRLAESLHRLGVDSIYALLLHRSAELLGGDADDVYRALQRFKQSGLVQKIGVSIYDPAELDAVIPRFSLDLVQAPFNLIDRRLQTSGWLLRLTQSRIEIHTRSVFLQGLLLMSRSEIPSKFDSWAELWNQWHDWLDNRSVSSVQACLAFPLLFSEIDRIVVGADSVVQLEQIIEAASCAVDDRLPDLDCNDENLINPSRWPRI